jgi:uncharacterized protein involved in type VI secretion and phage assembly
VKLERIVAGLVETVERRYYGKYRARVVDNKDPAQLGRLRLTVPSVLGEDVVTGWATPCVPYGGAANQGLLCIPDRGAGVWVEFEAGDLEFPIWVGTFWSKPGGESELPKPEAADGSQRDAVQDPPTRKIIKTGKGHTIQFEDADGEETILIREGTQGHLVTMDSTGITISDASQNTIEMTSSAFTLTAKVPFTIDAAGQPVKIVGDAIDFEKG